MQDEHNDGQHCHADHLNLNDVCTNEYQLSHDILSCQYPSFTGTRDRLIGAYLNATSGIPHSELFEHECRVLTAARNAAEPELRLRLVWLAIACRAQLVRRLSTTFVEYFPKGVHAAVLPTASERSGILSMRQLIEACKVAATKTGRGRE